MIMGNKLAVRFSSRTEAIKWDFRHTKNAFATYHVGGEYLLNKYWVVPQIYKLMAPVDVAHGPHDLSIHILTGHSDLTMLFWSLASFFSVTSLRGRLYVHSDGSLSRTDKDTLARLLPGSQVIEPGEVFEKYADVLQHYSAIETFRRNTKRFFYMKKLLDPYLFSGATMRLVLDTDILWFSQPVDIERVIKNQLHESIMLQGKSTGCYVTFQDGSRTSDKQSQYNAGMIVYHKDSLSLDKVNDYLERLDTSDSTRDIFAEQAGYASCLAHLDWLPTHVYSIKHAVDANTVMRHYTGPRRVLFYAEGIPLVQQKLRK